MVESVCKYDCLDSLVQIFKGIYLSLTGDNFDGGFLETGFKLIEAVEENLTDKVKQKAYAYQILYTIVNTAKTFYIENKNATNSFCF